MAIETRSRFSPEFGRALGNVVLTFVPMVFTAFLLLGAMRAHLVADDFNRSYYPAVRRLLEGGNPYAVTPEDVRRGAAFTYAALAAVLLAPFALVGRSLSDHLYMLLCLLLIPVSVWTAGVRDWRTYAIPLLWLPVIVGWQGGNVSVLMMFLVALAWRYRDRPLIGGLVVAVAISFKTFAWPLALWLLVTRRWKASLWAFASGALLNLVVWAIVGFSRLDDFIRLSGRLVDGQWRTGYSMLAVASHLGEGRGAGEVLLLAASAALMLLVIHQGLFRRHQRNAMVLAVALMLVASPVVWSHYFVLLLVPVAITRPRFGRLWLLPLALWVCPVTTPSGWQLALAWAVAAACFTAALRPRPAGRRGADHRAYLSRPTAALAAARSASRRSETQWTEC